MHVAQSRSDKHRPDDFAHAGLLGCCKLDGLLLFRLPFEDIHDSGCCSFAHHSSCCCCCSCCLSILQQQRTLCMLIRDTLHIPLLPNSGHSPRLTQAPQWQPSAEVMLYTMLRQATCDCMQRDVSASAKEYHTYLAGDEHRDICLQKGGRLLGLLIDQLLLTPQLRQLAVVVRIIILLHADLGNDLQVAVRAYYQSWKLAALFQDRSATPAGCIRTDPFSRESHPTLNESPKTMPESDVKYKET